MNFNSEMLKLYQSENKRKLGRFSCSDIYNILTGTLTIDNFFDNQPIDMTTLKNIWRGIAVEDRFRKDLEKMGFEMKWTDKNQQIKYEIKVDDFVIVVMPDFHILNGNKVGCQENEFLLELKCPNKLKTEIPPWYVYQLECQFRSTNLPVYFTQINIGEGADLVNIIKFKPSDVRWKNIQSKLSEFHKKLKEKNEKNK